MRSAQTEISTCLKVEPFFPFGSCFAPLTFPARSLSLSIA